MNGGVPLFYRITLESMGVNIRAAQRQAGLEQMLGGHARIANIMGPNEDIGLPIGPASRGLLCQSCVLDVDTRLAQILDALIAERDASLPIQSDAQLEIPAKPSEPEAAA